MVGSLTTVLAEAELLAMIVVGRAARYGRCVDRRSGTGRGDDYGDHCRAAVSDGT